MYGKLSPTRELRLDPLATNPCLRKYSIATCQTKGDDHTEHGYTDRVFEMYVTIFPGYNELASCVNSFTFWLIACLVAGTLDGAPSPPNVTGTEDARAEIIFEAGG